MKLIESQVHQMDDLLTLGDEYQLLLVSFFITNPEALMRIKAQWAQRNEAHSNYLGRSEKQTQFVPMTEFGGEVTVIDPQNLNLGFLARFPSPVATGMFYDEHDKTLYVGSGSQVRRFHKGQELDPLNHPLFNDVHSITQGPENTLLITSTALDAIIALRLGDFLEHWTWLATEHGYSSTPSGNERQIDKQINYQDQRIPTPEHTTHINTAILASNGLVYATLFHQGTIIEIDPKTNEDRVVVSGLKSPHHIREIEHGFMVSNTRGNEVIFFDKNFVHLSVRRADFNWVQDALIMEDESLFVADSNNYRIARYANVEDEKPSENLRYESEIRQIFSMLPLSVRHIKDLLNVRG